MNTGRLSKNGLFLMELIVVILLFSLCAAISLQMFAYGSATAQKAEDLSHGTMVARSGAACFQATSGDLEQMALLLSGTVSGEILSVGYDDQWQAVATNPTYTFYLTKTGNTAEIAVEKVEGDTIYTLTVATPKGGGDQ